MASFTRAVVVSVGTWMDGITGVGTSGTRLVSAFARRSSTFKFFADAKVA